MSAKHSFVDDYPFLAYTDAANTAIASDADVATLDSRLDAIEDDGWVTTDRLADEAVTTAKIADEAVTTAKIADEAVTPDKIAS